MSFEHLLDKINGLPADSIEVNRIIDNNLDGKPELIIIPGFSESSFERNYKTLFEIYSYKLPINKFKKIHLVKFPNNYIYNLHLEIFNSSTQLQINSEQISLLENHLYKKCGEILYGKFNSNLKYSVLAKSAGAGPAIFMCNLHPENFTSLNLFAPGVKFIHKEIRQVCKQFPKTIVGWNSLDSKVRLVDIWFTLSNVLPANTILHCYYYPDSSNQFDSQHEINTGFFDKIT